ncbi:M28 family peptidase [Sporosarcina sp. ITBMC105]
MKKNWKELFIGFGYEVTEVKEGQYDLSALNELNQQLLISVLEKLPLTMVVSTQLLSIKEEAVAENAWICQLEKSIYGRSEASYAPAEIPLQKIDVYIAGLVMQLNRLGYVMTYSCDGHERRMPTLYFEKVKYAREAKILLAHFGLESRRRGLQLSFPVNRKTLPEVALKVSWLTREDVERICRKNNDLVEEASFNETLEKLLSIRGESGNEDRIREFVTGELEPYTDHIEVDHYGNVVAIKRYGYGPTVLLNAHLDTCEAIVNEREIIKKGDSWTSSDGILGADDRAGVNVVLSVVKSMTSSQFKGTMKYIFTVQEEVGLQGARQIAKSFLWDVDMAFVIDHRGTHDIVT